MRTVVVIGGGFSGTLVALHLVRTGAVHVTLVELNSAPGRGVAYAPPTRDFLLNVPAGRMSAWTERAGDFLRWLQLHDPSADAATFAPRAAYGDYLAHLLAEETANPRLDIVRDRAIDLQRHGPEFIVTLATRRQLRCWGVVLALGNAPPRPLNVGRTLLPPPRLRRDLAVARWGANGPRHMSPASDRVLDNPLAELRRLIPDRHATVGIVGTGLTALDVMMWLERQGHRGRVLAVSRRGLTPIPHTLSTPAALPQPPDALLQQPTVLQLLRWLRATGRRLAADGVSPCRAVDALRPVSAQLWRDMTASERRRFCRHVRPYWDVHRHRAPPALAAMLVDGIAAGRIEVRAARFLGWEPGPDHGVRVRLRPREDAARVDVEDVEWLVNCTGPERDVRRQADPFVESLLDKGLVTPDPLGLGILTGPDGAVLDRAGKPVHGVFVIGPWRVAGLWESSAVPELRGQAAEVAHAIHGTVSRIQDPGEVGLAPCDVGLEEGPAPYRGADLRPPPGPATIVAPCSAEPAVRAHAVVPGP